MMHKAANGIWVTPTEYVSFADSGIESLSQEIAVRSKSIDFYAIGNFFLPNPDPVLKAQGKDIKIYTDLLVDDRVAGGMINRTAASKSMEWSIEKAAAGTRQFKATQLWVGKLEINRIIEQILKARAYGYAPIEILWGVRDGLTVPVDLVLKPQQWFVYDSDNKLCFWSSSATAAVQQNALNSSIFGIEQLPPRKFVCPRNEADYLNPYGLGLLSRCFWPVTFKRGGWKFWVKFAEKYGAVWPLGKLPRSATPEQRADLLDTLTKMIQDGAAVIPDDGSAEFLESGDKGGTSALFNDIVTAANSAISTVWLGHAGAGESTPGKLGSETAAVDVREDLRNDDANLIMQTMQQVIDWTCEINWGSSADSPKFILKEKEKIDTTQAERDDKLSTAMERSGLKLSSRYYQKTYKLDPEDVEEKQQPVEPKVNGPQVPAPPAFAEPAAGPEFTPEQQSIEHLKAASVTDWQRIMDGLLAPIREIIAGSSSFEEAKARLLDAYGQMDDTVLTTVLAQALFTADAVGRIGAVE